MKYYLSRGKEVYFITRNKEELYNIPGEPIYAYSLKSSLYYVAIEDFILYAWKIRFFPV